MRIIMIILAMSFMMSGCNDAVKSPSDAYLIPQEQMATVVKEANAGDLGAIKRLIAHYEAASGNDANAEEWRGKARSLGDAQELYYYAAKLFTGAKTETDSVKKREMLAKALKAAERSSLSHADASTKQLVEEITRSMKSM